MPVYLFFEQKNRAPRTKSHRETRVLSWFNEELPFIIGYSDWF